MWFWQGKQPQSFNEACDLRPELPPDLSQFLNTQLNGKEDSDFEQNLRKLATLNRYPSLPHNQPQEPSLEPAEPERLSPNKSDVWPQLQVGQNVEFRNQDTLREERRIEEYKRKNSLKSAVATNCSELQNSLFKCLKNGPFTDRIAGCPDLAKFCDACLRIQGSAFRTLQYDSINSIRRLEDIKRVSDQLFSNHFHNYLDCADDEKQHNFTIALNREMRRLDEKYGRE